MLGNLGMNIEIPPRNKSGRKIAPKHRAPRGLWIRHRDELEAMRRKSRDDYSTFLHIGRPEFGTVIGELYRRGDFDESDCAAARIFAEIVGRRDRYHQVKDPKITGTPRSPSYERGFGSGDDEIERRSQDGTIAAYERKARRAQRAGHKLDGCIVNERARAVLYEVCIYNRHPSAEQIPDLKAQLKIIWAKFQHRYQKVDDGKIKTWRGPADTPDHPYLAGDRTDGAGGDQVPAAGDDAKLVAGA